eukprot:scaffold25887_cov21-Prasinocladus_malaysianus.AAC.1
MQTNQTKLNHTRSDQIKSNLIKSDTLSNAHLRRRALLVSQWAADWRASSGPTVRWPAPAALCAPRQRSPASLGRSSAAWPPRPRAAAVVSCA